MSSNKQAAGGVRPRAARMLGVTVAAAVTSMSAGTALAGELAIVVPPMMAVTPVDAPPEAPAKASMDAPAVVANAAAAEPAAEPAEPVAPAVVARIDLSEQTMTVYVDEKLSYVFKVSTGRRGYGTPTGQWNAQWLSPHHRSKKYHNAPMPWSVFFNGGYAVHGTTEVRQLGRPASHGCVRLQPSNAKIFYQLVQENGKENTLVSIVR